MIDAHIHFESQPYTEAGLMKFIHVAQKRGMDTIMIVEHTHRFIEWAPLYEGIQGIDSAQDDWYLKKVKISIKNYQNFILEMRKKKFPITVKFGLEVCFFPEQVTFIKQMLHNFPYDFSVGSVHFVNHIAYDIPAFSKRILWDCFPTDEIYNTYFETMKDLIISNCFDGLAHPDTIKMFHRSPSFHELPKYQEIGMLLKEHGMYTENNVGCYYRYHHEDMGLNKDVLAAFQKLQVKILTASDAHFPEDVGRYIKEVSSQLNNAS